MASNSADVQSFGELHEICYISEESEDIGKMDCNLKEERYFSAVSDPLCITSQDIAPCFDGENLKVTLLEDIQQENENSIYQAIATGNEKLVLLGVEIEEDDDVAVISSQQINATEMTAANETGSKSNSDNIDTKGKKMSQNSTKRRTKDSVLGSPKRRRRIKSKQETITVDTVRDMLKVRKETLSSQEQSIEEPVSPNFGSRIVFKVQDCEFPFNQKVSLDIIPMDITDVKFNYLMVYKDTFTNYVLLRPLVYNFSIIEVSLELFKIFADFGIPNIVEVNAFYASIVSNAIKDLQKTFNFSDISVHSQSLPGGKKVSEEGENVKKRLIKWSTIEKSNNWATGCYVIQQYLNKKITLDDPVSPYIKVFGKNRVKTGSQKDFAADSRKPCVERNLTVNVKDIPSLVVRTKSRLDITNLNDAVKSKRATKKLRELQTGNSHVEPVTDTPILTTEINEDSVNTDVQSDNNSIFKNKLSDETSDDSSQSSDSTDKIRQCFGYDRKRRPRRVKLVDRERNETSNEADTKETTQPQPVISFESFSGLDAILDCPSKDAQDKPDPVIIVDDDTRKTCDKCGKEIKDDIKCHNCKASTVSKTAEPIVTYSSSSSCDGWRHLLSRVSKPPNDT